MALTTDAPAQESPPDEISPRRWRGAARISQIGLYTLAAGTLADGTVGSIQLLRGSSTPTLDALHTGSAAILGGGIGLLGAGGLAAAGALQRQHVDCLTWSGWSAVGVEAVGLGLILADPVLLAADRPTLPWWVDWVKLGALPFAILQIDTAERASATQWPKRSPLLGTLEIAMGPRQLFVSGRF